MPGLQEVENILRKAEQAGCTVIDTARAYGSSEEVLGLCGACHRFRVVTKLCPSLEPSDNQATEKLEASLSESLKLLRSERLDTVLFHRGHQALDEDARLWRHLSKLKAEGEILKIGVSAVDPAEAWKALELEDLDSIQVASSLLDRRLYHAGFFEAAQNKGLDIFVRSIYLQGLAHLKPENLPKTLLQFATILLSLDRIAIDCGIERWQLFLLWAKERLQGTLVIGQETLEQFKANLQAWEHKLPAEILDACESAAGSGLDGPLDPRFWG